MLTVVFFASVRERLGVDKVSVEWQDSFSNVADVIAHLKGERDTWASVLSEENLMVAVDQEMSDLSTTIADGQEIALFPPVTGG